MILVFSLIIIIIILSINSNLYIKSKIDNNYYKVQNNIEKNKSVKILSNLRLIIQKLSNNLNKDHIIYNMHIHGFIKLNNLVKNIKLSEVNDSNTTSYTINKGEEIVMCIKDIHNNYYNINDIIYVLIHELSHIVCPEIGHTNMFYDINRYILKEAIRLNIYQDTKYNLNPIEYCGIQLNEYLL